MEATLVEPLALPQQASHPLEQALLNLGVEATVLEEVESPSFTRIKISPSHKVPFNKIAGLGDTLQISQGYQNAPLITPQKGHVAIDIPKANAERKFCEYLDYCGYLGSSFTVPVGVDINNNLVEVDLSSSVSAHLLVAGSTGGGKSEWMVAAICSLLTRFTSDAIQLYLVDPKLVEFTKFQDYQQVTLINENNVAIETLRKLCNVMQERYELFRKTRSKDLSEYNKYHAKIPRIVIFFDEFSAFVSGEFKNEFNSALAEIAQRGRSAGLHLILATQRPDASVITPLIRSNITARIALKTIQSQDSKIILGTEANGFDSSKLLGKGDLIFSDGGTFQRLQGLYVSDCDSLLANIETKVLTNEASPASLDELHSYPGEANAEDTGEAISALGQMPLNQGFLKSDSKIFALVKLKIAENMAGSNDATEPLFNEIWGLTPEEKLLALRYLLNQKIGKENAISILWNRNSGGKYHSKYQDCSNTYERMILELKNQGYSSHNYWGFS
ncbi:MAG: hypothetical protein B7C55_02830 [Actinomycetales bacterium mxb001]|nr:MAG: hypothetical protein B7C55_02830 [Actinomycetales bacterium mxb001]